MQRYIAFIKRHQCRWKEQNMKELKAGFEELGFRDVVTYLNSGNVIFPVKVMIHKPLPK